MTFRKGLAATHAFEVHLVRVGTAGLASWCANGTYRRSLAALGPEHAVGTT